MSHRFQGDLPLRRRCRIGHLTLILLFSLLLWPLGSAQAAPLAQDPEPLSDNVTVTEDMPLLIDVLANDTVTNNTGANGITLTLSAVGAPRNGTAEIVTNKIRYTPKANFYGVDTFFYTVHNGDVTTTRQTTVNVTITAVNDAPNAILLRAALSGTAAPTPLAENAAVGTIVGLLMARDPDLACNVGNVDPDCRTSVTDRSYLFTLADAAAGTANDNQFFTIEATNNGVVNLILVQSLVGRGKASYTVGINVRDPEKATLTQTVTVQVTDTNDPPTAIRLSKDAINENLPAGSTVGTLTSADPDSAAANAHTYALVAGSGSDDNALFTISGAELRTAVSLDYEAKTIRTIRLRSTDNAANAFEQILLVTVNNLPDTPASASLSINASSTEMTNTLSLCQGTLIDLIEADSPIARERVLVQIEPTVVSAVTDSSCTVTGRLSIITNGNTVSNLAFRGEVNTRDEFITSSIADFELSLAGVRFVAQRVLIEYVSGRPTLDVTLPQLRMPPEFGGRAILLPVPTTIDTGGIIFGTGTFPLPSIQTASGFALELSGSLSGNATGFEINADGALTIPNIKAGKAGDQECSIGAGVTISVDLQGRTVMAIAAGDAQPANLQRLEPVTLSGDDLSSPEALEALRLSAVRASASCSPGLPIGSTGLFLTSVSGEITLVPGEERVDVEVVIEAAKSLPVLGPIVSAQATMGFQPSPFQLDLGGTIKVLVFEMARADATIRTNGFSARIQTTKIFFLIPYNTDVSIAAFTKSGGVFTFVGSGRVGIEMRRGSFGRECTPRILFVPPICILLPPFDLPTLAAARVDAGEFTNGLFGFKGSVNVLSFGSAGFFVAENGKFTFRNVDQFKLITPPFVAAARAAWQKAIAAGEVVNAAAAWNEFTFLQDEVGNNSGLIVDIPLIKPTVDLTGMQGAGATDVISQVNLIQHGDVLFNLIATKPLGLSLITPGGQAVTPANFASIPGYKIEYTQHIVWGEASAETATDKGTFVEPLTGEDALPSARLLFTAVSSDPTLTGLDLRIDGVTVYSDLNPDDAVWLTPIVLVPGAHALELRKHGTTNVVLQQTLNLITDTTTSLVSYGGATKGLALLADNNDAPATMGKAKVRFVNLATPAITMRVNGTTLFSNIGRLAASDYGLLNAGANTIEFRNNSNNALVSTVLNVDLADGGIYTFFATDDVTNALPNFDVQILQRLDARYSPIYYTTYSVDQALMNESWKVKVTGDTDNVPYALSVEGPDSPPILGSVTVDASNLAATKVSWQLTSDLNPTAVQIFINPSAISGTFTLTNTNGPTTEVIPLYEGELLAEFVITNPAELGGQLVTKVVDLSGLPSGTYHLWVRANDGINPPASSYANASALMAATAIASPYGFNAVWLSKDDYNLITEFANAAPIVINHASTFPTQWSATITSTLDAAANALDVEWQTNDHPDVDTYRLLFGNTPLNPTQVITVGGALAVLDANGNPTGVEVGFERLENIRPNVDYFISLEAIDSESGRSVRSQEVKFTFASTKFILTSQKATVAVSAGGSVTVPVTLNASGSLFFPDVWLTANLGGTPRGITAKFANAVEGFPGLTATAPTHVLEIKVDGSVADGIYPIVITGYNGEVDEALTVKVVVGEGGKVFLPIVNR